MQPQLFRQRLLELAAEYESLHAGAPAARLSSCIAPPGEFDGLGQNHLDHEAPLSTNPTAKAAPTRLSECNVPPGEFDGPDQNLLDHEAPLSPNPTAEAPEARASQPRRQRPERPSLPPSSGPAEPAAADGGAPAGPGGGTRGRGSGASGPIPEVPGSPAEVAAGGGVPADPGGGAVAWESEGGLSLVLDRPPSCCSEGSPLPFPVDLTPAAAGREAGRSGELRATQRSGELGTASFRVSEAGADFNAALDRAISSIRKSEQAKRSASRRSISGTTSALARFVNSIYFTVAIGSLIIISAILIGIETHVFSTLSYQSFDSPEVKMLFSTLNYIVTALFTVELGLRLYVYRLDFFVTDRWWNCFDLIILLMALAEVALELIVYSCAGANQNLFDNGGTAKMMRLIRLTRLLRLVRTFRQLKPLRMLVRSLMAAGKSVFWALLLLFLIIFAFGVILTQAVTEHTAAGTRLDDEDLISYFGDLTRSMMSLWMAVSGGISWIELTRPLGRTGNSLWIMLFLVYILIVYFFILNVVTGVFCQNAIEGAAADLDLTLEAQLKEKQTHVDRLALLFHELNEGTDDDDFELSLDELDILMKEQKVQSWFKSLDVDATQTSNLFKCIDADESGTVSIEEFVSGCLQLRGPATRVDVESLKWEIRHAEKERAELVSRQATLQG